ncbi:DUF397 domain-containing protein [Streptomyces netropsis]|uniref:DUF397 domain-containing protein n=1 Tax=Streptomyces netropsis TaxID=55404 RepID=A0A7W7LI70_STRNE|nr:DUF397 domain-containing protein [Streptomyces netropsis]MBB4890640.1 hypothetical protein [Streptomyces netropsis]
MGDQNIRPHWRRSSFSTAGVDNCVEVAFVDHEVWVRDSHFVHLPALSFTPRTWSEFLAELGSPTTP